MSTHNAQALRVALIVTLVNGVASQVVTTVVGTPGVVGGYADGTGALARMNRPMNVVLGPNASFALVTESGGHVIRRVSTSSWTLTTIAGHSGNPGLADGQGTLATFFAPSGIAMNAAGTFAVIADESNSLLRRLDTASGTVTTLAGSRYQGQSSPGFADGAASSAQFRSPRGVALDAAGSAVLVADTGNNCIRRVIIRTALVSTIAGRTASGYADGSGASSMFNTPTAVAVDAAAAFAMVLDSQNMVVRLISSPLDSRSLVATLAGTAGSSGMADGLGTATSFSNLLSGVTMDAAGSNALITDGSLLRRIVRSTAAVSTVAGSRVFGSVDGIGTSSTFGHALGAAMDPVASSFAIIGDSSNHVLRYITLVAASASASLAQSASSSLAVSASTSAMPSSSNSPEVSSSIASNTVGASPSCSSIPSVSNSMAPVSSTAASSSSANVTPSASKSRSATPSPSMPSTVGGVTTLAGSVAGYADGQGPLAEFNGPVGVALDATSTFGLVADHYNHLIRHVELSTGMVTTLAGSPNTPGLADGVGSLSSFNCPNGVAISGAIAIVSDRQNSLIRLITLSSGAVSTLAGSRTYSSDQGWQPNPGYADGQSSLAQFNGPIGVAIDATGITAIVTDTLNHVIRSIVLRTGLVSTLAGTPQTAGLQDGPLGSAMFNYPMGLSIYTSATSGTVIMVADSQNNNIRVISTLYMLVQTLAGSVSGMPGLTDGVGTASMFNAPHGVSVNAAGDTAVISDYSNNVLRLVSHSAVTTLAGGGCRACTNTGSTDGIGQASAFYFPYGVAMDPAATFSLVADSANHKIRLVSLVPSASASSSPRVSSLSSPAASASTSALPSSSSSFGASPSSSVVYSKAAGTGSQQQQQSAASTTATFGSSSQPSQLPNVSGAPSSRSGAPIASTLTSLASSFATAASSRVPPAVCSNEVLDGMETDVDCGGSACSPCAKGRICAFDSDCGAVGGASATSPLIVCSTASRLCTDPRVGVQAYGPGTGNPPLRGIVSLNLTLGGVSPAGVTPTLISAVEAAVAAALTSLGLAQSSTAAYVIIVLAVRVPPLLPIRQRRLISDSRVGGLGEQRLLQSSSPSSELWLQVLLPNSTAYSADAVSATINANPAAFTGAVQAALVPQQLPALTVTLPGTASMGSLLPSVVAAGPAPASASRSGSPRPTTSVWGGAASGVSSLPSLAVLGLALGVSVSVLGLALAISCVVVRTTGSCCGSTGCCVPMATCCGACPLRVHGAKALASDAGVGDFTPPGHRSEMRTNPMANADALRNINAALEAAKIASASDVDVPVGFIPRQSRTY